MNKEDVEEKTIELCGIYEFPDPKVIFALISHESGWNQYVCRYEKNFKWLNKKWLEIALREGGPTWRTEQFLQMCSLGLCQIMGATARDFGFTGEWLTQLFDPFVNVKYGVKIMSRFYKDTKDIDKSLLRYNGGADPGYPKKVLAKL